MRVPLSPALGLGSATAGRGITRLKTIVERLLVGGIASLLTLPLLTPALAAEEGPDSSWIVTLSAVDDFPGTALALTEETGGQLGFVYDSVLGGFSFEGTNAAAAALERHPLVRSVTPDGLFFLDDVAGWGIFRIDADDAQGLDGGTYRGSGIRVAVIDSGIDLDHPDLAPNLDTANGKNCINNSPPDDDHSHGTHVAGIAAAAYGPDGFGVVGVAPEATLVPVKSFSRDGSATTSQVLCGINHVASLAADGVRTIANMSFGETGSDSECDDADSSDVLHEAVCDLADAGVVPVAAAGNSSTDTTTFIPAAFDEVIAVSALTDFDGKPGGDAGCKFTFTAGYDCDDTFAVYSNYGPDIDVMAPGTEIYSTLPGGGHGTKSGTSMAAPHVSGVVAAMLSANTSLTTDEIRLALQQSGECPEPAGSENLAGESTCVDQGQWPDDPDGITEPLANALRAVQAAVDLNTPVVGSPPSVSWVSPVDGDVVAGTVGVQVDGSDADDAVGSLTVEWRVDGGVWESLVFDSGSGFYEGSWDTTTVADGGRVLDARVADSDGNTATAGITVTVDNPGYDDVVIGDGALAFWRLGEGSGSTAFDWAGSHDAAYQGSPGLGAAGLISGDLDTAVLFDGVDDLVAVPDASDINTGGPYTTRTVELWFDASDVTSRRVLYEEGGVTRGLAVYLDQGDLYFIGWNTANDDSSSPWGPVWVSVPVTAGSVNHSVLVFDQTTDRLEGYLNGESVGVANGVGNLHSHAADIGIGAMNDGVVFHDGTDSRSGTSYHFEGILDEPALYPSALTLTQIQDHYTAGGG